MLSKFSQCIISGRDPMLIALLITAVLGRIVRYYWSYLFTSLFFIIGFPFSSTFGGFTGPIPANSIIDTILHDPYPIIGHLHYAPPLGAIYSISAAVYTY